MNQFQRERYFDFDSESEHVCFKTFKNSIFIHCSMFQLFVLLLLVGQPLLTIGASEYTLNTNEKFTHDYTTHTVLRI